MRPYQQRAIESVCLAWQTYRRVLLQLPTGGGKTVIFSKIIELALADGAKQVAVLTHREELLWQAQAKVSQFCNCSIGVIKGSAPMDLGCPVQLISVMTLARRYQLLDQLKFDLIVIDEAHHATAASYTKIVNYFSRAKVLGVTATPCRTDGSGFAELFEVLIDSQQIGATIKQLIQQKYLSDFRIYAKPCITTKGVDWRGADYDEVSLAKANPVQKITGSLLHTYSAYGNQRKCVCFAINVEHSQAITAYYNQHGIPALHLDGAMSDKERLAVLDQFRHGNTLILCNCNIITEGFDLPEIEVVQLARPTRSLALYLQMVGRALRYKPDKIAAILDHANNWQLHGSPKDDLEWSLAGVAPSSPTCYTVAPNGEVVPSQPVAPEDIHQESTLKELNQTYLELVNLQKIQQAKGYKKGWIAYRFLETTRTREELLQCAQFLGYKKYWVDFTLERQNSLPCTRNQNS